MPWSDQSGPVPRRSEEELLALTRAKAAARDAERRGRLGVALLATVVLIAGVATAITRAGGDGGTEVRTASGPSTSPPTVPPPLPVLPPTTAPVATTQPVPATTTTRRPAVTTTVLPATTAAPSTTSTTSTTPDCTTADYIIRASSDRPSYPVGQPVRITFDVENRSGRACFVPASRNSGMVVTNAAGEYVSGSMSHAECLERCGLTFAPTTTISSPGCWNQRSGQDLVPPGMYTIVMAWYGEERRLTIEIAAPSIPTSTSAPPQTC